MASAKPVTGDVVTLKGQSQAMTVIDQPTGAVCQEGWVWLAYAHAAGVAIVLLPIGALTKKQTRR